jgi:S1-C subfamily serine protease
MLKRIVIPIFLIVLALGLTALAQDEEGQAYLGIYFDANDAGVLVTRVLPGSPADDADVQRGDIITDMGGEAVTAESLPTMVLDHKPGDTLDLTVLRDNENLDLSVTWAHGQKCQSRFRSSSPKAPKEMP